MHIVHVYVRILGCHQVRTQKLDMLKNNYLATVNVLLQADLTLTSFNKEKIFYGFCEYGKTLDGVDTAYAGKSQQSPLANKVLQFVFNGLTGFRFPVCHYPIVGMDMRQLRQLISEVITGLSTHGFQVNYLLFSLALPK